MRGRRIGRRAGDNFVIRVLQAIMSAAILLTGLGLVLILFWILVLDVDSGAEIPDELLIMLVLSLAVTVGCHWVIRWVRPALR